MTKSPCGLEQKQVKQKSRNTISEKDFKVEAVRKRFWLQS